MGHRLSKIYTRTGDAGTTGLGDGTRVAKTHPRIEAYGTVDEANSALGLAAVALAGNAHGAMLMRIQNDLFDLGADLCRPGTASEGALRIAEAQVLRLEREIDAMNERLQPLRSFVLPGGTPAAAFLHQARTVTRRAERLTVELAEAEAINSAAIRYLNRLSDHLFVLSRALNDRGAADVLWVPGANR